MRDAVLNHGGPQDGKAARKSPWGRGAYTNVDGHKMTLGANDLVLTPNGTCHEHGVSSDGSMCLWQTGLDIPFVNAMEANFYEVYPDQNQAVGYAVDDMTKTWGNAGLTPSGGNWQNGYSRWSNTNGTQPMTRLANTPVAPMAAPMTA